MRITSFAITVTNKIAVSITSIKFLFTTKLERSVFFVSVQGETRERERGRKGDKEKRRER